MPLLTGKWRTDQLCVNAELLTGCCAGEQRHHERQVIQIADEALHAHQRDVDGRQGCDHARIAFIAHETYSASFRDTKIDAADPDIRSEEDVPQKSAGSVGECRNVFGIGNTQLFMEELTNV